MGCIPSKALLDSSEHYHNAAHTFATHGIDVKGLAINLPQMIARKDEVVTQNVDGIQFLMKKNKVDVHHGLGSFVDAHTVKVTKSDGSATDIQGKNIIIATGSKPASLPFITIDKKRVITSTEALKMKEIPKHLIVIGGGVIGMELGSVYGRLGAKVTVVEYMDSIIPTMDKSLGKELQKSLKKIGFEFFLKHKVTGVENLGKEVVVKAENAKGETVEIKGDYVLVSIGRKAYTDGLNAAAAGVMITDRGQIEVNDHLQTAVPHIYAIGDVVKGAMLAHKAEEEGVAVAQRIVGKYGHVDFNTVPWVIYTSPEIAWVGKTEQQVKGEGVEYRTGSFPFMANGRARALGDTTGFVKFIADKKTDRILGVHIIGPMASELIAEAVVAMEFGASSEDISMICHAHPSLSEAMKEAALAVDGRTLNL